MRVIVAGTCNSLDATEMKVDEAIDNRNSLRFPSCCCGCPQITQIAQIDLEMSFITYKDIEAVSKCE